MDRRYVDREFGPGLFCLHVRNHLGLPVLDEQEEEEAEGIWVT